MELAQQEYPALAAQLQPQQACAVVGERLRSISRINSEIADWLLERRRLEEAYVLGLRRLARRTQPDPGTEFGIFEIPWRRIVTSTEALAESHENFAGKVELDVERPLKEYTSKQSGMQTMSSAHEDLMRLAKEVETAQKRAAKSKVKPGKSSAATAAVDDAKAQWDSRAPFVFEKLQSTDEHRINHLRDVLTQFQTHEADKIERDRQTTEGCLNALLNLQSADEIKTFAAKASGGRSTETENNNNNQDDQITTSPSANLPPPPKIQDDTASQRSNGSHQRRTSTTTPENTREQQQPQQQRHSPLGGLRRLGTVMSRRKSIAQSNSTGPPPEKRFRSPFTFRRNDSSRNFQPMDSEPVAENGIRPEKTGGSSSSRRQNSLARRPPTSDSTPEKLQPTTTNGTAIPEASPEEEASAPAASTVIAQEQTQQPNQSQVDSEGYSTRPDTFDEISRIQREAAGEESAANLTIRDKRIEEDDEGQAKQAMSDMANALRLQAQQTGISRGTGTLRGRRDVRNTIFIPNPSSDEQSKEPAAHAPVAAVSQGLSPAISPGNAEMQTSPASEPKPAAASKTDVTQEDHPISDNASVHSSHTLHSLSGPISHPELHSPGLNASVVEKLGVLITGGTVSRSYVVGELAMAYNSEPGGKPPSEGQLIRLSNFHILERVAANPQFVTETRSSAAAVLESEGPPTSTDQDKKGEYKILLPSIVGSSPHVAFKYQIHLDSSNLSSYCPVIFTPIWNEEEFQASVIITYSLNPNFISPQPTTSITLRNLTLNVNLDLNSVDEVTKQPREVARATGAAMHPNTGATFRRKTSAVVWKIPELVVTANDEGKFLARFSTSTSWPRKGKVEAKFDAVAADDSMRLGVSAALPGADEIVKSDDPFADESSPPVAATGSAPSTWKELPTERKLAVARYVSS